MAEAVTRAFPMIGADDAQGQVWADGLVALALVALDPPAFGGLAVKAHAGPVREALLAALRDLVPDSMPVRRMPGHIADERLLGGLDMAATLKAGRPVVQKGLLSEADGGLVLVPMAERMEPLTASRLSAALDRGTIALERDGIAALLEASVGVIALDEGIGEEGLAAGLADRLAFPVDLTMLSIRDVQEAALTRVDVDAARPIFEAGCTDEALLERMTALAAAFGVSSVRATLFAIRAARGIAALDGRCAVEPDDMELAARLVIAPRATQLPTQEAEAPPDETRDDEPPLEDDAPPPQDDQDDGGNADEDDRPPPDGPLDDQILEAVEAAIPPQLLERLRLGAALTRNRAQAAGGKGAQNQALLRGRPIGSRRGRLDGRGRLHLVDTLRAAAPWQPLRKTGDGSRPARRSRIVVTPDDVRLRRFKQNEESVTIFVVDASGSAALHRLAEVKGAVELLLAESYARRDYVALIIFRGDGAELVLPPTRSLVRAKRCLAGVPGGGGTPLAAGLDAGLDVALDCRRLGRSPRLVVMSDAKANVGYDPTAGRAQAFEDAQTAARRWAAHGMASLMIDTSPQRGRRQQASNAAALATTMGALHLALPQPNAAGLKALVDGEVGRELAG